MPTTPRKFVRNIPVKAKCPFPSAMTLSLTFAGLYSRIEVAFEKLLRMFVCKFGMFVAKFKSLFWSLFGQFTINQLCKFWLTITISHCSLFNRRKYSERTSKQTLELCNEHSELTNEHSKWFFKSKLKSRASLLIKGRAFKHWSKIAFILASTFKYCDYIYSRIY